MFRGRRKVCQVFYMEKKKYIYLLIFLLWTQHLIYGILFNPHNILWGRGYNVHFIYGNNDFIKVIMELTLGNTISVLLFKPSSNPGCLLESSEEFLNQYFKTLMPGPIPRNCNLIDR